MNKGFSAVFGGSPARRWFAINMVVVPLSVAALYSDSIGAPAALAVFAYVVGFPIICGSFAIYFFYQVKRPKMVPVVAIAAMAWLCWRVIIYIAVAPLLKFIGA
jgi:hypothetical protein